MNQRLALGLSVAGVLLAGSAAALVNTQILSANTAEAQTAAVAGDAATGPIVLTIDPVTGAVIDPATSSTVPAPAGAAGVMSASGAVGAVGSVPPVTVAGTATIQATADTAPPAEAVTTTTTAPAPSTTAPSTTATYRVGTAGSVTLDTADDRLRVTSAVPAAGWSVLQAVQESPTSIVVTFRSADTDVVFRASLSFGVVNPTVESIARTTTTVGGADHDDDDDGYDDHDDHDDDDHADDDDHDDDHDDDDDDDHEGDDD